MNRLSTTASRTGRLRRSALVCSSALVAALAVGSPAAAQDVTVGETRVVTVPAVDAQTVALPRLCEVDEQGGAVRCTQHRLTTPGTRAASLRLTWSFTGAVDAAVVTLVHPLPRACDGGAGVMLGVGTTGVDGVARVVMAVRERNGLTGSTTERVLVDVTRPVVASVAGLRRVLCLT